MSAHSSIVGGSTAKRVINCPASVKLAAAMPPKPSSRYADKGTLLHNAMAVILGPDPQIPEQLLGMTYEQEEIDIDDIDDKLKVALAALDELDPLKEGDIAVEQRVEFGLPGVFGSCDLLMRAEDTAIVLDWKFGDGVPVEAEGNEQ
jgi:hypothetical protein